MEKSLDEHVNVTNRHYDITGQEILRIGKHYLISKLSRYEDLGGGPGLKCSLVLFILHYFSRSSEWMLHRFENQFRKLLKR